VGQTYYQVTPDALANDDAARDAFSGFDRVIDVQTHFMASRAFDSFPVDMLTGLFRELMPAWWRDLDGPPKWDIAQWLIDIFIRTENTIGVLTSSPGLTDLRNLFNDEMAATRALVERFGGSGRLLTHAVVHANVASDTDQMQQWSDELHPNGWKVYTMGQLTMNGWLDRGCSTTNASGSRSWSRYGRSARSWCARTRASARWSTTARPATSARPPKRFPDIKFLVYHPATSSSWSPRPRGVHRAGP